MNATQPLVIEVDSGLECDACQGLNLAALTVVHYLCLAHINEVRN